jgi:glycosyltransferase involved in cell wall biosynthesis
MNIKVSVIVTCHSGTEPYFEECLESIKAQVIKPYEIIVVVDGYIKPMLYPETITIIRDKNKGVAYSRDQGVRVSTGTHLLFVDADDVLPENYIKEMVELMKWTECDIIYPSCLLWSRWGNEAPKDNSYFDAPEKITFDKMIIRNSVLISSLMKREVYEKIGGFDPNLDMFEDWYFFLKALILKFKFFRGSTFLKYRQRTLSRNHINEEHKQRITDSIKKMIYKDIEDLKKLKKSKKNKTNLIIDKN